MLRLILVPCFINSGCQTISNEHKDGIKPQSSMSDLTHTTIGFFSSCVIEISFSPNGKTLAVLDMSDTLSLRRVIDWKEQHSIHASNKSNRFQISPDSKFVIVDASTDALQIWNLSTGKHSRDIKIKSSFTNSISYSPSGRELAVGGVESDTLVLNSETGKVISALRDDKFTNALAFSPDGRWLARGSFNKPVEIYDAKTWKCKYVLQGHTSVVNSVVFSPDNLVLASGDADGMTILWNVLTGKEISRLSKHSGAVHAICWFPDNKRIATAGGQDVFVWNTISKTLEQKLTGASETPYGIAVSSDGKTLVSGGTGRSLDVWGFN